MYYSTSTFQHADISDPDVATCGFGVVSIVMVAISVCYEKEWLGVYCLIKLK